MIRSVDYSRNFNYIVIPAGPIKTENKKEEEANWACESLRPYV